MSLPEVRQFIMKYKGQRVFFDSLWGNNGDKLITLGSMNLFRECGVKFSKSPKNADIIVLNGGAGMSSYWGWGALKVLYYYAEEFPEKPIVVLPSSWQFKPDMIKFPERRDSLYLYAREPYSFELLREIIGRGEIYIGLDHDMAFHLQDTLFLNKLRKQCGNYYILIVERGDAESATNFKENHLTLTYFAAKVVPKQVRMHLSVKTKAKISQTVFDPIERTLLRIKPQRKKETPFYNKALSLIKQKHPGSTELPVIARDISLSSVCSFKEFTTFIAKANVVVTTRLHVAILAAMLGKTTYLKEGSWHKIKGVYEYSLKKFDWVHLI